MSLRFASLLSAMALTVSAGLASAGELPASGEHPFADFDLGTSSLTRAEVIAAAIAAPPAVGESIGILDASVGSSTLTRAEVMAAAIASPPAVGEMSDVAAATGWVAHARHQAGVDKPLAAVGRGYRAASGQGG